MAYRSQKPTLKSLGQVIPFWDFASVIPIPGKSSFEFQVDRPIENLLTGSVKKSRRW